MRGGCYFCSPAFADPREVGIWYDDTGKGAVKIEICTPTTLCGKIYWLKEPLGTNGEPKIDRYNPEPSMRARPICGLPVLGDLQQLSEGGFDNGWVYDPKEGKSYSVALDLVAADTLEVTGYKGMRFLGKSFIWTRVLADLPSCAPTPPRVPTQPSRMLQAQRPPAHRPKPVRRPPTPSPSRKRLLLRSTQLLRTSGCLLAVGFDRLGREDAIDEFNCAINDIVALTIEHDEVIAILEH